MLQLNNTAKKVLSKEQQDLLPLVEDFWNTHFLIGGTAISLQLGHRKSIDFDFINNTYQWSLIEFKKKIEKYGFNLDRRELEKYFWAESEKQDEFHFTIHWVQLSCFNYYRTLYDDQKINIFSDIQVLWWLKSVSLKQLLCMKLFACMTRNKWKDAVDIYFILHKIDVSLQQALEESEVKYFIHIFSKKSVLEQFISGSWDTTESVEYLIKNPPQDKEIIQFLKEEARKLI